MRPHPQNATQTAPAINGLEQQQEDQRSDHRGHYPENKATAKTKRLSMVARTGREKAPTFSRPYTT
jgi:hypothetical protein